MENQQDEFHIKDTSATRRIFDLKKRIRAVTGGTAASKTISILIWLIDYCQSQKNKDKLATVVSESYPHLEKGAMRDFEVIMKDRGYWKDRLWNNTKHIYTFETGNKLEFMSVDTYGKAHGPRRHILFVNECNNLAYNIVDQLIIRTKEVIWLDWNPVAEFWFYTDMMITREKDLDFITLTYKDNEALDQITIDEIESHRNNKAWWTVYGLGQLGQLEGRIYTNWQIINQIPHEARLERYGLDFGYSNDPTVIIAIYRYNDGFILDEITYQKGLSNKTIADIFINQPRALVIADSAEPKSIDEIKNYGVNIIGAIKGADSVYQGIQYVQNQKISITERSIKTIKAYRNYLFITDKDGKVLNDPDDTIHEWSNSMDAIRYGLDSFKPRLNIKPQTDFGGIKSHIPGLLA
jgi:phage terminase large subunit